MGISWALGLLLFMFSLHPAVVEATADPISLETEVSAFVGYSDFDISGYTSPFAKVVIEGQGIYQETYADKHGKFVFKNQFSPLTPRDVCITATDTDGRLTQPVCLPPFPVKSHVSMGPILLPPSLSLNQSWYRLNDNGILRGKAAPNSRVFIALADTVGSREPQSLVTRTDDKGIYSLTLPTQQHETEHIFSRNTYLGLESDKSFTLTFEILPLWLVFIRSLSVLVTRLMQYLLPFIFIAEFILLALLLIPLWKKRKSFPLMIRPESNLEDPDELEHRALSL